MLRFCKEILNGNRKVDKINHTIIILIPKVTELEDMTQFRPINLCWVIYKIISKVWANRLKSILSSCINKSKCFHTW